MGNGTALALYEIASDYREAVAKLSELDLDEQTIADTLEGLRYPLEQKAQNVAAFSRNLEANAEAIGAAIETMRARQRAILNRAERLREYIRVQMHVAGVKSIDSPWFKLSIRANPPKVEVFDETSLPAKFLRTPPPPPPAPDKKAIGDALKAGETVSGAKLTHSDRLEIK